jgi:hypothetical protein
LTTTQGTRPVKAWAAFALAGAGLLFSVASADGSEPGGGSQASCSIRPRVLDTQIAAESLIVRIELFSSDGLTPLPPEGVEPGIRVSSVAGVPLPEPDGRSEGIGESFGTRTYEDVMDLRGGVHVPNGLPELVARFVDPSDGDPTTTEDGNAGDVLAMLMDVPDGETVEVCIAGRFEGSPFRCCDSITIRNRGLRDLPGGVLRPDGNDRR